MSYNHDNGKPIYKKGAFWVATIGGVIIIGLVAIIALLLLRDQSANVGDTSSGTQSGIPANSSTPNSTSQKTSSDKTLAYVKNYVGQNLASACDWSWTDRCLFSLDAGSERVNLIINIISPDGRSIENDDTAKAYKIVSQSLPQNTQISVTWDDDDWTLSPKEMDVTVEAVGTIREVTKTGELERYVCESKGNHTGRVVSFIRKNSSSGLQSDSYDIVRCEWQETVVE